jgi:hypothetical protein
MYKNKWIIFLINLLITTVFFLIYAPSYAILYYINSLFYLSLVYLIVFLFMYTTKGGFFDGITFGFRRFNHVILKQNDYLEEWREKPLPSEKLNVHFYQILKFQALALIVLLSLLLVLYYSI